MISADFLKRFTGWICAILYSVLHSLNAQSDFLEPTKLDIFVHRVLSRGVFMCHNRVPSAESVNINHKHLLGIMYIK